MTPFRPLVTLLAPVLLAGALVPVLSAPALAADAAVPAALVVDEQDRSSLLSGDRTEVLDTARGARVRLVPEGTGGVRLQQLSESGDVQRAVLLTPPTGQTRLPTGRTPAFLQSADGKVGAQVVGGFPACAYPSGSEPSSVTISDVAYSGDVVTRLVATVDLRCDSKRTSLDLRYGSSEPYRAVEAQPVRLGEVPLATTRAGSTVLRNVGTLPVTLGTAVFEAVTPGFSVTDDGCSGRTLAPAETCPLSVAFRSDDEGYRLGRVRFPADTSLGARTVSLFAHPVPPPRAPRLTAYAGDDGVGLVVAGVGAQAVTEVLRVASDSSTVTVGRVTGEGSLTDSSLGRGEVGTYRARTSDPYGTSPDSPDTSAARQADGGAPSGPVDALVLDTSQGSDRYDSSQPPTAVGRPTVRAFPGVALLDIAPASGPTTVRLSWPRTGLTAGTYRLGRPADVGPEGVGLTFTSGRACGSAPPGTLTVRSVRHRADGTLLQLDADADLSCTDRRSTLALRVAAPTPAAALVARPGALSLGVATVGSPAAGGRVTLTNEGTTARTLGAPTVTGDAAPDVRVTTSCPASLAPGAACTLDVSAVPSVVGVRTALVEVPDDTPLGRRAVPVSVTGRSVPGAVSGLQLVTGTDEAQLSFGAPSSDGGSTVTGYTVERRLGTAGAQVVGSVPATYQPSGRYTWTDPAVPAGTVTYSVRAINATGTGPAAAASGTRTSSEVLVSLASGSSDRYALAALPLPRQGGRALTLVDTDEVDTPAVSRDGTRLAWSVSRQGAPFAIAVSGRGRRDVRVLTAPGSGADDTAPAFSPDGRTLVFTRATTTGSVLATVPVAGGATTVLPGSSGLARAAFTRDGARLVSATDPTTGLPALVTLPARGGTRTPLPGGAAGFDPVVTPDGARVVFGHVDDSSQRSLTSIRALPVAGGTATVVANPSGLNGWPTVSSDGRTVAFEHASVAGGVVGLSDVVTARADGSGDLVNVTQTPDVDETEPALLTADRTAPAASLGGLPRVTTRRTFPVVVTLTDAGSGPGTADLRYRAARPDGALGGYVQPASWQGLRGRSVGVTVPVGTEWCLSVRGRDVAGNVSGWSPERCVSVPVDDPSLRPSGAVRSSATGSYGGTVLMARRAGATVTLPSVRGRGFVLVVSTCPACGAVTVSVGGGVLGTVDTRAATARRQVLLTVPRGGTARSGPLVVRSTSGRTVVLDGVAVLH
ncbi:MAG: fibronectin type protein [Frankiales bacterium]|nr:fibronectin type protein [Frankiales bacterium]